MEDFSVVRVVVDVSLSFIPSRCVINYFSFKLVLKSTSEKFYWILVIMNKDLHLLEFPLSHISEISSKSILQTRKSIF